MSRHGAGHRRSPAALRSRPGGCSSPLARAAVPSAAWGAPDLELKVAELAGSATPRRNWSSRWWSSPDPRCQAGGSSSEGERREGAPEMT